MIRANAMIRPALALPLLFLAGGLARAGEFPDVDALPSQAGFPDPLVMFDGTPVRTADDWFQRRRPELKELFQYYMYGYQPAAPEHVEAAVAKVDTGYFGGKATRKLVTIQFGPPGTPAINLLLVVPNQRSGPAPAFVGMNFCGNHAAVNDPEVPLPATWIYSSCAGVQDNRAGDAGRGSQVDVWAVDTVIDRGYALATFYSGDIDPDRPDFSDGVHPHYLKPGQTELGPHDWGTISAWAWGISRAVDYLVTDPDIDARRIAVVGHSRLGKTALLAAAFDQRIALAIPHQAGCGGTAPSRGTIGESVQRINEAFPHWFNDTFPRFGSQVERLPFDQHSLAAMVAPRPLLFTNAVEDSWANPGGQFEVLQAADKVYRFLGAEGLEAQSMPEPGQLINSNLGYFIREGQHSMTRADWQVFLEFADKHLK